MVSAEHHRRYKKNRFIPDSTIRLLTPDTHPDSKNTEHRDARNVTPWEARTRNRYLILMSYPELKQSIPQGTPSAQARFEDSRSFPLLPGDSAEKSARRCQHPDVHCALWLRCRSRAILVRHSAHVPSAQGNKADLQGTRDSRARLSTYPFSYRLHQFSLQPPC
jgi:hypothetical protein